MKEEKEELYRQAKEAYYLGDPIMSDEAFDFLEEELKDLGSPVINIVGSNAKGDKFKHLTPMASLAKIQFRIDYEPTEEFQKWVDKILELEIRAILEFTCKYDGNSCNLIYANGILQKAITRGDGVEGQDLTEKVKNIVPQTISQKGNVEVRGEILMKTSVFEEHYSTYKNPRNFVGGLLGRDTLNYTDLDRLTFMAFELRIHESSTSYFYPDNSMGTLYTLGFNEGFSEDNIAFKVLRNTDSVDLVEVFNHFTDFREISEFLLDGFVCKAPENLRKSMGETSHHPKWAMAIKFPPKSAITKVSEIEWNLGKGGVLTPVGILDPVDLDGSTVSRVTLHNYEWIIEMGVCPGATVEIIKSGDIIPAIVQVLEKSTAELIIPETYEGNKVSLDKNGKKLYVENAEQLDEFVANKLYKGVSILGLQYIGLSMCSRLVKAGVTTIFDVFDPEKMNDARLIYSGEFKLGRELERLISEVKTFKETDLWKLINSIQFDRLGKSLSKETAAYLSNIKYDWSGYEKVVVEKIVDEASGYQDEIERLICAIQRNGTVVNYPEEIENVEGTYEMTGSPKEFGFKTKAEFIAHMKERGLEHGKLTKDATYLITDSIESSSSKMKKAEKLGVAIKLYSDFI